MPIEGMTGKNISLVRSMPCLGRLHKGAERTPDDIERKRPGKDLDYFRFVAAPNYDHVETAFNNLYGPKPRSLDKLFMLEPEIDKAFDSWMEDWSRTACLRRCDKIQQILWFDGERYHTEPKPCESDKCNCKPRGRLAFQIPALVAQTGEFGYIAFSTGSGNDIRAIDAYLRSVCNVMVRAGRAPSLAGIPFVLERFEKEVNTNINGKRSKLLKWLVKIKVDPTFVQAQIAELIGAESANALMSGAEIEAEEADSQTGEFVDRSIKQIHVPRIASASDADETVDPDQKINTDALRTKFFKAVHRAGVPSVEAGKRLKAANVTDLKQVTWSEAWSVVFDESEEPEESEESGDNNF